MAKFLEIKKLAKSFGDVQVLKDLDLTLDEGEILALLGLSGSGKTTALRILAGFEAPDHGEILLAGEDVTGVAPAKRGFGMVFQHYALFPHMTVAENVAFGLKAQRWPRPRIGERVDEVLALVDLPGFGERKVSAISGGQQQRVAVARALAPEPRLLLLDEPLSNLDPALRERTRRELREAVRRVGITTVLVTHEQEEAFDVGDRVAVLNAGRLEQVARPEELYREPASRFVATFIGRASTVRGVFEKSDGDEGWVTIDRLPETGTAGGAIASWSGVAHGELLRGQTVDLVVKPETLRLASPEQPGAVRGQMVERRFTGALTYCVVRLANGQEIEVLEDETGSGPPPAPRTAGDEVFVNPRGGGPRPRIFLAGEGDTAGLLPEPPGGAAG